MTARLRRPSPATLIACAALLVALGGPAEAAKLINGKLIRKGTVSSKQIRDHGVTTRDLSKRTVRSLKSTPAHSIGTKQLADGAVGAAQLQLGSVTAGALAANAITGTVLADGSVGSSKIAADSITTDKIGNSQVKKADIGTGAVGQSEIATNAVAGNEVANGSLAGADLGDFSGALTPTLTAALGPDKCATYTSPVLAPNANGATIADDILLIGRPATTPTDLTVSAQPASGSTNQIALLLCNTGTTTIAPTAIPPIPFVGIQP
jgi:hypothetical protein